MSTVGTTARQGAGILASLLRVVGLVIVAVLVVFIVLTLLDAYVPPVNYAAEFIGNAAGQFNLGLDNLFKPAEPKLSIALNYGVAAIVWLVITTVVVRLVRRIA